MRQYECKKGDVIYFYNDFVYNGGTITATSGDVKVELLGTTPSAAPEGEVSEAPSPSAPITVFLSPSISLSWLPVPV